MKLRNAFNLQILGGVAALVLGIALAAPAGAAPHRAPAGGLVTEPGVYDASVVYIPGISVPGGLPDCVNEIAQQIYVGTITVARSGDGYRVSFAGVNSEDSRRRVNASAVFSADWGGFALGPLGGREDAIVAIDAAHLVSGRVNGIVIGQNGGIGALVARVGAGGVFESCALLGPAAH